MADDSKVRPDGTDWVCGLCEKRYPWDYDPVRCDCGRVLARVLVRLTLR